MKTLEGKFVNANINSVEFAWMDTNGVKECVNIAEEFAIGFTDWIVEQTSKDGAWGMYDTEHKKYIIKELLGIYKKEKGL